MPKNNDSIQDIPLENFIGKKYCDNCNEHTHAESFFKNSLSEIALLQFCYVLSTISNEECFDLKDFINSRTTNTKPVKEITPNRYSIKRVIFNITNSMKVNIRKIYDVSKKDNNLSAKMLLKKH